MKIYLNFNTRKLIQNIKSLMEFYELKENKNNLNVIKKYKKKRGRPFSIVLPKEIKISPEIVGLIIGEGFFSDRHFVFANSNEIAIKEILGFLKQFNLPIKFYLEISVKGQSKDFVNRANGFWNKYLNIKINKIRLRREFKNITRYGTIHIILNNSLITKLLKEIMKISKIKVEKNKEFSVGYLKGILAAEGNVNIKKKTNCVYMVRISASKREERNHYKRCLKRIGIKIYCKDMQTISKHESRERGWKTNKGRAGAVIISKWENFIKIFDLGLLDLSEDKKKKFLQFFANNKFTKQFLDFGYFLDKEFTMKEAQIHFGFSGRHIDRVLTLYKQGYLSKRKINKIKFVYRSTKKYISLYNKLNSILNNPIY